ncbi:Cercosporin biosynthesis regulatory protein CTB8 [Fulvia fulva]|uniref:Cercosporin biosynthesis regulatory protein CTB8 n=1 Tax=Passalora fulva TaxID=5499 RepID=A0A9Q8PEK6_PASFU|nr:Cercosporin biosynthesis regulatory protein CTB8 [Fulvia fulva]KAK4617694.1 Cercosporin biosynthesis regulatory protein CTB8 [Fulvia fulva]KAK4618743.1 Cercosporin biosynthesis regulatory protein CTB8 [Fulvia fulva]UJO21028.1 Cercosporin biosynthesis regulatory protein CTB8 [Fulvia fulva]WPV17844.1 Cercosporin biosynthesis regulatory protein CTB8 [Fulvia fulva]WPV33557.1 Cercosporin biosynthesis regulatory protein CTB8 [Fulvia fulva]
MADTSDETTHVGKQQKVRESCNACSSLKIRCGKERPRCSRCASRGIDCEYSMSRRTGQRQPSGPVDHHHPGGLFPLAQTPETRPHARSFSFDTGFAPSEPPSVFRDDFNWNVPSSPGFFDECTIMPWEDSWMIDVAGQPMDTTSNMEDVALFDNSNTGPPAGLAPPATMARTTTTSTTSSSSSSGFASQADSGYASQADSERTKLHLAHRDCAAVALQVVADMLVANIRCLTAAESATAWRQASALRDADAILESNSQALGQLTKILECPCAKEQDVMIAVYLALSKAIAWYSAIMGPSSGSQGALLSQVSTGPIYMGGYQLDEQAQCVVRAQVVLSQIRQHVQPTIEKLVGLTNQARSGSPPLSSTPSGMAIPSTPLVPSLLDLHLTTIQGSLTQIVERAESFKHG